MKLLELLVKERIEWHPAALCYTQDGNLDTYGYSDTSLELDEEWEEWSAEKMIGCTVGTLDELADDWETAIVTKEQYDNACKLVDDGYTLWFGGECPVHPHEVVEVVFNTSVPGNAVRAKAASIETWNGEDVQVLAYRVAVAKPDSSREPIRSVPVVTEYPAHSFLEKGVQHMKDRAGQRDSADGERSMAVCVNAFNAMFDKDLTETQGWQFMVLLKMARSRNKFNPDDYEDGAAYTGLAGEAHSHE